MMKARNKFKTIKKKNVGPLVYSPSHSIKIYALDLNEQLVIVIFQFNNPILIILRI